MSFKFPWCGHMYVIKVLIVQVMREISIVCSVPGAKHWTRQPPASLPSFLAQKDPCRPFDFENRWRYTLPRQEWADTFLRWILQIWKIESIWIVQVRLSQIRFFGNVQRSLQINWYDSTVTDARRANWFFLDILRGSERQHRLESWSCESSSACSRAITQPAALSMRVASPVLAVSIFRRKAGCSKYYGLYRSRTARCAAR